MVPHGLVPYPPYALYGYGTLKSTPAQLLQFLNTPPLECTSHDFYAAPASAISLSQSNEVTLSLSLDGGPLAQGGGIVLWCQAPGGSVQWFIVASTILTRSEITVQGLYALG
jgi:hypothetical protein